MAVTVANMSLKSAFSAYLVNPDGAGIAVEDTAANLLTVIGLAQINTMINSGSKLTSVTLTGVNVVSALEAARLAAMPKFTLSTVAGTIVQPVVWKLY